MRNVVIHNHLPAPRRTRDALESVTAYYIGMPGDPEERKADALFKKYGGRSVGRGTMIAGRKPKRDIQYDVPEENVAALKKALRSAGFTTDRVRFARDAGRMEIHVTHPPSRKDRVASISRSLGGSSGAPIGRVYGTKASEFAYQLPDDKAQEFLLRVSEMGFEAS